MSMALEGIRVLDWSSVINGPLAAGILADMGAEVIHIEHRVRGDMVRGTEALFGTKMKGQLGINTIFELCNRSKKSLTIDFEKDKGKQIIYQLTEKSDVFLTSYRRSLVTSLGLDYETLRRYNPKLIYAITSGYGTKGDDGQKRVLDYAAQARSGLMMSAGDRDGPPGLTQGSITDNMGAVMLALAIVTGLLVREQLGIGQEVETSMLGATIYNLNMSLGTALLRDGAELARHSRTRVPNPLSK